MASSQVPMPADLFTAFSRMFRAASPQLERGTDESDRSAPFIGGEAGERPSPRHEAAVDQHCRSRDPFRFVAGKEQRRVGDIFGLACAPNGLRFGQSPLAAFAGRTSDRGIDTAGTDAIDADAILAQFDRCAIGEVDYTRLGGAVDRRAKASLHPRHRSGGDDRAASRLTHLGNRILDAEENSAQENRVCAVPTFGGYLLERADCSDQAGVVEGYIEAPEFADRARNQRLDVGLDRDVDLLENGAASILLALTHGRRAAFLIEVRNHHCCPFAGETNRSRAAHAACRAGYDSDLVIEPSHFDDLLAPKVRFRLESD